MTYCMCGLTAPGSSVCGSFRSLSSDLWFFCLREGRRYIFFINTGRLWKADLWKWASLTCLIHTRGFWVKPQPFRPARSSSSLSLSSFHSLSLGKEMSRYRERRDAAESRWIKRPRCLPCYQSRQRWGCPFYRWRTARLLPMQIWDYHNFILQWWTFASELIRILIPHKNKGDIVH